MHFIIPVPVLRIGMGKKNNVAYLLGDDSLLPEYDMLF